MPTKFENFQEARKSLEAIKLHNDYKVRLSPFLVALGANVNIPDDVKARLASIIYDWIVYLSREYSTVEGLKIFINEFLPSLTESFNQGNLNQGNHTPIDIDAGVKILNVRFRKFLQDTMVFRFEDQNPRSYLTSQLLNFFTSPRPDLGLNDIGLTAYEFDAIQNSYYRRLFMCVKELSSEFANISLGKNPQTSLGPEIMEGGSSSVCYK